MSSRKDYGWGCLLVQENLTEVQKLIVLKCLDIADMLLEKNRKYGNSALEPKRIFSKASTIEQINVRLDDKLSRKISDQKDEDEDVDQDIVGYLILKLIARDKERLKDETQSTN